MELKFLKDLAQSFFGIFGAVVISKSNHYDLLLKPNVKRLLTLVEYFEVSGNKLKELIRLQQLSRAQLDQDLLAALVHDLKRGGYFVEFGSTNGRDLSNTFLLEKGLDWSGILAEPGIVWHRDLISNRTAHISRKAVWKESGANLNFLEDRELSTLSQFKAADGHTRKGRTYSVTTVTLLDLLNEFQAPKHIEFLSVDTEGSELEVLSAFDFSRYSFGLICVEHNFTENREKIQALLGTNGYVQILPEVSEWDDWFVPKK